jgi:hypothetical protein
MTGDPKATMHYDKYEKLLVVERGVELVNWPEGVPFVNASEIGSFHALRKLWDVLSSNREEGRCHWVQLSEVELKQRRETYYAQQAQAKPLKRKRKAAVVEESDSDSQSDESVVEEKRERPTKVARKAVEARKENENPAVSARTRKCKATNSKSNGTLTEKGKQKGKGKGKEQVKGNSSQGGDEPMLEASGRIELQTSTHLAVVNI